MKPLGESLFGGHFLGLKKKWEPKLFRDRKNSVNFDVASVIIRNGDMKFEKGFSWIYRDTSPALITKSTHYFIKHYLSTQDLNNSGTKNNAPADYVKEK